MIVVIEREETNRYGLQFRRGLRLFMFFASVAGPTSPLSQEKRYFEECVEVLEIRSRVRKIRKVRIPMDVYRASKSKKLFWPWTQR